MSPLSPTDRDFLRQLGLDPDTAGWPRLLRLAEACLHALATHHPRLTNGDSGPDCLEATRGYGRLVVALGEMLGDMTG